MRRSGVGSGGGIGNNKIVTPGLRTGTAASGITAGHAGQIGAALGNHAMDGPATRAVEPTYTKASAAGAQKLGNELTTNVGKGGPGTGRTVMQNGTQGTHGSVNPGVGPRPSMPKDVHAYAGPEIGGRRR